MKALRCCSLMRPALTHTRLALQLYQFIDVTRPVSSLHSRGSLSAPASCLSAAVHNRLAARLALTSPPRIVHIIIASLVMCLQAHACPGALPWFRNAKLDSPLRRCTASLHSLALPPPSARVCRFFSILFFVDSGISACLPPCPCRPSLDAVRYASASSTSTVAQALHGDEGLTATAFESKWKVCHELNVCG
jgi:hypothetical protein